MQSGGRGGKPPKSFPLFVASGGARGLPSFHPPLRSENASFHPPARSHEPIAEDTTIGAPLVGVATSRLKAAAAFLPEKGGKRQTPPVGLPSCMLLITGGRARRTAAILTGAQK